MTSASSIIWSSSSSLLGFQDHHSLSRPSLPFPFSNPFLCSADSSPLRGFVSCSPRPLKLCGPVFSTSVNDAGPDPDGDSRDNEDKDSSKSESESGAAGIDSQLMRDNLERMVGTDDSTFNGMDLATLIRNKYGRSYDVQLIKKEFMGRNLLALNVMWKYREQRSFPLTEEEYILRLNDVANTLKCWGAVSHIRNSLATVKERPRIGKAVSIFIDMDETGGRANEWIYK